MPSRSNGVGQFDLSGKIALVTGGGRGLGRAITLGLAACGADVVIASRKLENCQSAAEEVERLGRRALAVSCHVGRWDEIPNLVDAAYDRFGRVDILVNNAGLAPVPPSMSEISEGLFDSTINVNLKGPLRLGTLIADRMVQGHGGSIINISSMAALKPRPATAVYAAAKAGLNAITTALAQEYGPKVRVNAIGSGPFRSDASSGWIDTPEWQQKAHDHIALRRTAEPDELVGTVIYLASDASSFTTGALIPVDGGERY